MSLPLTTPGGPANNMAMRNLSDSAAWNMSMASPPMDMTPGGRGGFGFIGVSSLPQTDTWVGLAHGDGLWIAVARSGALAISDNTGATWKSSSLPSGPTDWLNLAYGNGVWVAAPTNGAVARSTDRGRTWTPTALTVGGAGTVGCDVAFANGRFMLVAYDGASTTYSASSTNGFATYSTTVMPNPPPFPYRPLSLCYDGRYWAAMAASTNDDGAVYRSADNGASWTFEAFHVWSSPTMRGRITASRGTMSMLARNFGGTPTAFVSYDGGSSWLQSSPPNSSRWIAGLGTAKGFVAVTDSTGLISRSSSGSAWTQPVAVSQNTLTLGSNFSLATDGTKLGLVGYNSKTAYFFV